LVHAVNREDNSASASTEMFADTPSRKLGMGHKKYIALHMRTKHVLVYTFDI
jgi:hypothetical protein